MGSWSLLLATKHHDPCGDVDIFKKYSLALFSFLWKSVFTLDPWADWPCCPYKVCRDPDGAGYTDTHTDFAQVSLTQLSVSTDLQTCTDRETTAEHFHSARPLGQVESWYWSVCLSVCMSVCLPPPPPCCPQMKLEYWDTLDPKVPFDNTFLTLDNILLTLTLKYKRAECCLYAGLY